MDGRDTYTMMAHENVCMYKTRKDLDGNSSNCFGLLSPGKEGEIE